MVSVTQSLPVHGVTDKGTTPDVPPHIPLKLASSGLHGLSSAQDEHAPGKIAGRTWVKGHNPNDGTAWALNDSLKTFRDALERSPDSGDLIETFETSNELQLETFFANLNLKQSRVNTKAMERVTNIFALFSAANQSTGSTTANLDQLYGVLHCSFMVGHSLTQGSRAAAEKMEVMGLWTMELDVSELEVLPAYIAWDKLALFSNEVVKFCIELVTCRTFPIL